MGLWPGVVSTRVWLLGFLGSSIQLYMLLSLYLGFISFLYLHLYFLVDDASMVWGSLTQTKHIFVLIHFRNKGKVGTLKHIQAHQYFFYWLFFRGSFLLFWISYQLCCFACSLQPCDHLLRQGWPLGSIYVIFSFVFVTFLCGFLGQVRHLIALITELCFLLYLVWSTAYLYAIIMVTGDYTLECHRNIEDWPVYVLFAKSRIYSNTNNYILFDLILYVPSKMFQLCRDGSSWVDQY